jgi:hypothetical protein
VISQQAIGHDAWCNRRRWYGIGSGTVAHPRLPFHESGWSSLPGLFHPGFVIGTRNGGNTPVGTLFHASFPGPAWINGGPLGTEASWFMLPAMVALFLYLWFRYPVHRPLDS